MLTNIINVNLMRYQHFVNKIENKYIYSLNLKTFIISIRKMLFDSELSSIFLYFFQIFRKRSGCLLRRKDLYLKIYFSYMELNNTYSKECVCFYYSWNDTPLKTWSHHPEVQSHDIQPKKFPKCLIHKIGSTLLKILKYTKWAYYLLQKI